MKEKIVYSLAILKGQRESVEAIELLKGLPIQINFQVDTFRKKPRSFTSLPLLIGKEGRWEGIEAIKRFVSDVNFRIELHKNPKPRAFDLMIKSFEEYKKNKKLQQEVIVNI